VSKLRENHPVISVKANGAGGKLWGMFYKQRILNAVVNVQYIADFIFLSSFYHLFLYRRVDWR
jgi:hypothetical protein